jgi:hypothetical protein
MKMAASDWASMDNSKPIDQQEIEVQGIAYAQQRNSATQTDYQAKP